MSHYRNLGGGKRDSNEPQIMKRFRHHGWHAEQISGNRLWDLQCYPPEPVDHMHFTHMHHVDVKQPDGEVTKAQREKWTVLHAIGIPVYVVRTEADVDALVVGTLAPWEPSLRQPSTVEGRLKPSSNSPLKGDAAKARKAGRERLGMGHTIRDQTPKAHCPNYTPPRSTLVDAAKACFGDIYEALLSRKAPSCTCSFRLNGLDDDQHQDACDISAWRRECEREARRQHGAAKEAEATFAAADGVRITSGRCAVGGCWGERAFGPYCGTHRGMGDPD